MLATVCSHCPGLHPLESSGKSHVSTLGMEREPLWPGQQSLGVASGQRSLHCQCWRVVLFTEAGCSCSPDPSTALPLQPPRAQWRRPPQCGPCERAAQRCRCRGIGPFPQAALSMANQLEGPRVALKAAPLLGTCVDRVLREARRTKAGFWPPQQEGLDPRCPARAVVHAVGTSEKNAEMRLSRSLT